MRVFGRLILIGGLAVTGFFFAAFDTTVAVDGGTARRVQNAGLLSDRQNGMILGAVVTGVGGLFMLIGEISGRRKG